MSPAGDATGRSTWPSSASCPSRSPQPEFTGSHSLPVEDGPGGPRPAYLTACGRGARSRGLNGRASQTFAVWSPLPVTIREPSGLNDAE